MDTPAGTHSIELNQSKIAWELDAGRLHFHGLRSALFWLDPSMVWLLMPLVEELGVERFRLLVAHGSSLGTREDYEAMITSFGSSFEEGFLAWGQAVSAAGWGKFSLRCFDRAKGRATVRVDDAWELAMQKNARTTWGCPFLLGKIIGIFSHALGVNCWADEIWPSCEDDAVEFHLYPSDRTIEADLEALRRKAQEEVRRPLEEAERALFERLSTIERQQQTIKALETPILKVWEGVLAVPIMGVVDSQRAADVMRRLLDAVANSQSQYAILDLTAVEVIDTATVAHFDNIIRATSLLGAECVICGMRPAVAQTMVELGVGDRNMRAFATMQSALQTILPKLAFSPHRAR